MSKSKKKKTVMRDSERRLVTINNPKSPISEQYRTIRTNIQFSMVDTQLKTLACTSAMPGEGKSTTITNLAIIFAQQGKKVLLVDADLRKPTIHQLTKVKNQYGLTGLITKGATPDVSILPMPRISNLHILPSGPIPPNPSELLGTKRMEQLISELSLQYDLILFDTPPVLIVTDAQVLGSNCDGVILVVKSHQTEKTALLKAKELLDKANINLIGTVINGVKPKEVDYNYYYGED